MVWKQRKTAEGLVRRPDLSLCIAGAPAIMGTPTPTGRPNVTSTPSAARVWKLARASRGICGHGPARAHRGYRQG